MATLRVLYKCGHSYLQPQIAPNDAVRAEQARRRTELCPDCRHRTQVAGMSEDERRERAELDRVRLFG